jgi:CP family cyanate transporter-like MFS transporter
VSAAGPFGIGLLYHATGGWTWPLLALTAMSGATAVLAIVAGRPQCIEDQLRPAPAPAVPGGGQT